MNEFSQPISEIIKKRTSVRTYEKLKPVEDRKIELIQEVLKSHSGEDFRFEHVFKEMEGGKKEKLGTYGSISGADNFLLGIIDGRAVDKRKTAMEFGGFFEKIILKATDMGLGTCWMIASFNRKKFSNKIDLSEKEFIAIVSPFGYPAHKRRTTERIMRKIPGSDRRKPWNEIFFTGRELTGMKPDDAGIYRLPLEMLRLAPSAVNYQPWRVVKHDNCFDFYICRDKIYKSPHIPCEYIDLGIAMSHFELSIIEADHSGKWYRDNEKKDITERNFEYAISWAGGTGE